MTKRILHLTLKKKWFDLIAQGKKKEEYREDKPYWRNRLMEKCSCCSVYSQLKQFDEVHFKNGYHKKCPFMRVKWKRMYQAKVDFEDKEKDMFVIKLGKILEIKNWKTARGKYLCKKHGYLVGHPNKEVILIGGGRLKENDK